MWLNLLLIVTASSLSTLSWTDAVAIQHHHHPHDLKCGYKSCPGIDSNKLNIHLIPHSHDDVGWLKTADQYFYGSRNQDANAGVELILDSVIPELIKDRTRKFIEVEMFFFFKWYEKQSHEMQQIVQKLVRNGQLEFIGGGWTMNDEACTHYSPTIDQMSIGLRNLVETFGVCAIPRVAWQIDPFGHSREQASLFAQMGFDGLFFARADYQDIHRRIQSKELEMIWRGNPFDAPKSDLFTHIMARGTYGPPPGFCWDVLCTDDPIIDDQSSFDYNVDQRLQDFMAYATDYSAKYKTNNILVAMGEDFNYMDANRWYKNMDKLIKYMNQRYDNVSVFYSTPSCYLEALHQANLTWTVKTDDFFPYASDPHAYWSGYFTSRPAMKYLERFSNNLLQAAKQMATMAGVDQKVLDQELEPLVEAQAVAQHHDAVTGTEKQHVAFDYAKRLAFATSAAERLMNRFYAKVMPRAPQVQPPLQVFCPELNVSSCAFTTSATNFTVTVYNPIVQPRTHRVSVPVAYIGDSDEETYTVMDGEGHLLDSRLVELSDGVKFLSENRINQATFNIEFNATLPAGPSFRTYFIQKVPMAGSNILRRRLAPERGIQYMHGGRVSVEFDSRGRLAAIVDHSSGKRHPLSQDFFFYKGMKGRNEGFDDRASGAYIFRPNGTDPLPITADGPKSQYKYDNAGNLVEVHQQWGSWISQVIRHDPSSEGLIEFEWVVGPIPIEDGIGKEVITKYVTDLKTDGEFKTDANGRQTLLRKRNHRESWNLNVTEPIAGNYYPVNSRISIEDKEEQMELVIMTDRSEGGGSIQDGEVEVMVHRRLLYDDAFGVGEALNEPGLDGRGLVVKGSHFVYFGPTSEAKRLQRSVANKLWLQPIVTFGKFDGDIAAYQDLFRTNFSALAAPEVIPANLNLLTLEPLEPGKSALLRLEHLYDPEDDPQGLSKPLTVDVNSLFKGVTVTRMLEYNLAANEPLDHMHRMSWKSASAQDDLSHVADHAGSPTVVTLKPLEIRTFVVEYKWNH